MRIRFAGAVLAALLYTLIVNSGWMFARSQGQNSPAYLHIENHGSADQSQYFAYINLIGRGNFVFGNPALVEHEKDPGGVLYGPFIPGFLKFVTGLSIEYIAMIMNLLCPFLSFYLLWVAIRKMFGDTSALAFTSVALTMTHIVWLRQVSPQLGILFFFAYLAVYLRFASSSRWGYLLRGAIIGILIFVQIQEALYLLIVEGCDGLFHLFSQRREWRTWLRSALAFLPSFVLLLGFRVWLSLPGDPTAMADTQRRFGLIASHLPTYPTMQVAIIIALLALAITFIWKRSTLESTEKRLIILLVAALLALNQSVFTGFDAMFRSYYRVPFTILLWLTAGVIVVRMFGAVQGRPRTVSQRLGYGVLFALSILTLVQSVFVDYRATAVNAERLEEESVTDVAAWLNAIPEREIVAAPLLFADLVPALTHHSVLLSHYARFGVVTDAELADRFLLQRSLYPAHDYATNDRDLSVIFGQGPGNLGGRARTWCKLTSFGRDPSCAQIDNRSFIVNQDVFTRVNATHDIDEEASVDKYNVSLIFASGSDKKNVPTSCVQETVIGMWTVYRCGFARLRDEER